jgi:hypothetical protein
MVLLHIGHNCAEYGIAELCGWIVVIDDGLADIFHLLRKRELGHQAQ